MVVITQDTLIALKWAHVTINQVNLQGVLQRDAHWCLFGRKKKQAIMSGDWAELFLLAQSKSIPPIRQAHDRLQLAQDEPRRITWPPGRSRRLSTKGF